jgi:hypothetical protein
VRASRYGKLGQSWRTIPSSRRMALSHAGKALSVRAR